ncbi:MAG: efflux RND transporter periplasmic adaptor subunit [Acidobacteria bacterium]|nr:efflux RND transporter periplasmic adaptor subunit [Acidobacteriota bacterium]
MKRPIIVVGIVAVIGIGAGAYYMQRGSAPQGAGPRAGGGPPGGGFGGFGGFGGGGPRLPMAVETGAVARGDMATEITVVGNLIGAATVEAVPKLSGRLQDVSVRLGDRVVKGQRLAKLEDREIQEQVKQAEASFNVSAATIRQREADLRLAQTNLDRSRNLFERQLIPQQTFDDTEARYEAAVAQLDLARAQYAQAKARLDELNINLSNTVIVSPVTGYVGKRALDPGAWLTTNSSFISVVDISLVRLVANVVEKDLRQMTQGLPAKVTVDAYPGETFAGRVAHVAPVLDPATRTAQIEVEIENPEARLKPGMYATVTFTVGKRPNTLMIPTSARVDAAGSKGVFLPSATEQGQVAVFRPIEVGLVNQSSAEVTAGLDQGETIVTTGAAALRDGDRIVLPGETAADAGGRGQGGGPGGGNRPAAGAGGPPAGGGRGAGGQTRQGNGGAGRRGGGEPAGGAPRTPQQ